MAVLRRRPSVRIDAADADGLNLLGALRAVAVADTQDVILTCGSEQHPPLDPHTLGHAFDVRTHNRTPERRSWLLRAVLVELSEGDGDEPAPLASVALENLATRRYFGQIEDPDGANAHLHLQRRNGVAPL